jgi:hypothetical protein
VNEHRPAIAGQLNVGFEVIEAQFERKIKRLKRIFRCVVGGTSVGDEDEVVFLFFDGYV